MKQTNIPIFYTQFTGNCDFRHQPPKYIHVQLANLCTTVKMIRCYINNTYIHVARLMSYEVIWLSIIYNLWRRQRARIYKAYHIARFVVLQIAVNVIPTFRVHWLHYNLAVVINILLDTISEVSSFNWQYKTLTLIYLNNLPFIFDFLRTFLCLKSQNMHPIAGARQTSAIFVWSRDHARFSLYLATKLQLSGESIFNCN